MRILEAQDRIKFTTYLQHTGNTICGRHPIVLFLAVLEKMVLKCDLKFLKYAQSSQALSQSDSSVSYASAAIYLLWFSIYSFPTYDCFRFHWTIIIVLVIKIRKFYNINWVCTAAILLLGSSTFKLTKVLWLRSSSPYRPLCDNSLVYDRSIILLVYVIWYTGIYNSSWKYTIQCTSINHIIRYNTILTIKFVV